jgi:hypothetical protein
MKAITILAALMLGTAANAFPAHQQDGYRDTGDLLYTNNPTCGSVGGGGNHADFVAAYLAAFPVAEEPEEETPTK